MSKKLILFSLMMITSIMFFSNRISAMYETPDIIYSGNPEHIMLGEEIVVNFTINAPGVDSIDGSFRVKGSQPGRQTFKGRNQRIRYHKYFPNGGWHWAEDVITPEVIIDVIGIGEIEAEKEFGLIFKYAKFKCKTIPPGYEDNIIWKVDGANTDSGFGEEFSFGPTKKGTNRIVAQLKNTNTYKNVKYYSVEAKFEVLSVSRTDNISSSGIFHYTCVYMIKTEPRKGSISEGAGVTNAPFRWNIILKKIDLEVIAAILQAELLAIDDADVIAKITYSIFGAGVQDLYYPTETGKASEGVLVDEWRINIAENVLVKQKDFTGFLPGYTAILIEQPVWQSCDFDAGGELYTEGENSVNFFGQPLTLISINMNLGPVRGVYDIYDIR